MSLCSRIMVRKGLNTVQPKPSFSVSAPFQFRIWPQSIVALVAMTPSDLTLLPERVELIVCL